MKECLKKQRFQKKVWILFWFGYRMKSKRLDFIRHSHASMLIEMGVDIFEISKRLGHESIKTTIDTYGHLYPDKDQKLADRLNQFRRTPPEEST